MLNSRTQQNKKRWVEVALMVITSLLIFALSRIEIEIYALSQNVFGKKDLLTTFVYFALININIILILFLGFLIFRNVTKLVVERKRGVFGSKLKTKLVFSLIFFALAPTILLVYVSGNFIIKSFDAWFSHKITDTMRQTQKAGSEIYIQDQKRLQSLARIALQRVKMVGPIELFDINSSEIDATSLEGFDKEYGINVLRVFDIYGRLVWSSLKKDEYQDRFNSSMINQFNMMDAQQSYSRVVGIDQVDVVQGMAPIRHPKTHVLLGVVVSEVWFETQILKSIDAILKEFSDLKPSAQIIQFGYIILLIVMTFLIVFIASWLGFYVAKEVTGPLQTLAEATREIALGNYNLSLNIKSDDETGQLITAFNKMARDLFSHQKNNEEYQLRLQKNHAEIEQKKQYIEIVLKSVKTGVISLGPYYEITSINEAAQRLLQVSISDVVGKKIDEIFDAKIAKSFWKPVYTWMQTEKSFQDTLIVDHGGYDHSIIVHGNTIKDDKNKEVGFVLVIDDADEQVKNQRMIAWKDVAKRIAHEIKNPITPIKLNAQRLQRKFGDRFEKDEKEVFDRCMGSIIKQVDLLRDLVNEFSQFARLPQIKTQKENLSMVIYEVMHLFKLSYPEVEFDLSNLSKELILEIDKEQMNRVFVNIINNSLAAMDGQSSKIIKISSKYDWQLKIASIFVADNGCGIPKNLKDRVFEPYISTKQEGSGLGLTIVYQIMTDHRGYVRMSDNKPRGTVVSIELPLDVV